MTETIRQQIKRSDPHMPTHIWAWRYHPDYTRRTGSALGAWDTREGERTASDVEFVRADEAAARVQEAVARERERWQRDCGILLAQIDYIKEITGEGPEDEDRALVEQIRASISSGKSDA